MSSQNPSNDADQTTMYSDMYKRSVEFKNTSEVLALLSLLYKIGISALTPKEAALRISQALLDALKFELVGILDFVDASDSLVPLAFAKTERLAAAQATFGLPFDDMVITDVTSREIFHKAISAQKTASTRNLDACWHGLFDPKKIASFTEESHIKTILVCPLATQDHAFGVLMLAINRSDVETLTMVELESIENATNVVALALEKANLYQRLEEANAKLRELDRQKDGVLHMVAHQLKGPVTTINFTTELLLDGTYGELAAEQKEKISAIRTASQKMGSQSEMVLDAAKITSGKLPLKPEPVDLQQLFTAVVNEAENTAKQNKVRLTVSLPTSLPMATLDKKYTQIAIDNLLSNAIKYTAMKSEGGTADFTVEVKENTLFCTVRDTGIGIPKKDQENIFKELYRASNAGNDGNGLGLHVTKGAIEGQGGKLWFESKEGVGTTFFVSLPLA